jgi:hypothetical protein
MEDQRIPEVLPNYPIANPAGKINAEGSQKRWKI